MKHSDQFASVAAAFVKAQAVAEGAKKDSNNPHFKSKYADLESVFDAIRKGLAANDLAVFQDVDGEFMTTRILHSSGEWLEGVVPLLIEKRTMQGLGSAMTYARRYGLMAAMGIAPEDDDGSEASKHAPQEPPQSQSFQGPSGGMPQTKLNAEFQKFCTELGNCVDPDGVDVIKKKYLDVLKQVKRDQPTTWAGTEDFPSVEVRIKSAREAAAFVSSCKEMFAAAETRDELNACFSDNKAAIETLPVIHKTAVETAMTVRDQELSGENPFDGEKA